MTQLAQTHEQQPSGNGDRRIAVHDTSEFANLLDSGKFAQLWRVAQLYADTELVPGHFRGKPSDCFIACQMALRMGVDPYMFMQNTYVVAGRPGMEAKLAIALINSSGLFTDALDYEIQGDNPREPKYRVRAFATRKSTGKVVHGPWVDWETVKAERWDQKNGSKWLTIPGLMFQYRAATFFGRLHCPERMMGMHTADELDDMGGDPAPKMVVSHVVDGETKADRIARRLSEQQQQTTPAGAPGPVAPTSPPPASQSTAPEAKDVEGVDAEPPEETQRHPDDEPVPDLKDYAAFFTYAQRLAHATDPDDEQFRKTMDLCLVAVNRKGKANATPITWREEVLKAIRHGTGTYAAKWAYLHRQPAGAGA